MVSRLVLTRYDDLTTPALARMLNFTVQDLRANRAGTLTRRQRRYLKKWYHLQRPRHLIGSSLLGLLALLTAAAAMLLQALNAVEIALRITAGVHLVTLMASVYIINNRTLPHRLHVACVTGHVRPREMTLPNPQCPYQTPRTFYFITVNDMFFQVQPHILRAFHPSRCYRLYFVEDTYTLLSVELVE